MKYGKNKFISRIDNVLYTASLILFGNAWQYDVRVWKPHTFLYQPFHYNINDKVKNKNNNILFTSVELLFVTIYRKYCKYLLIVASSIDLNVSIMCFLPSAWDIDKSLKTVQYHLGYTLDNIIIKEK